MALNKDFKVKNSVCVGDSLNVTGSACIGGDTTIHGNLSVCGDETILRTIISTTSALSVVNTGTGPAYAGPGDDEWQGYHCPANTGKK